MAAVLNRKFDLGLNEVEVGALFTMAMTYILARTYAKKKNGELLPGRVKPIKISENTMVKINWQIKKNNSIEPEKRRIILDQGEFLETFVLQISAHNKALKKSNV